MDRRMVIASLLTWVPLLVLTLLNGGEFGAVKLPFIYDIEVHVRFLIVLSMLIYAEMIAYNRIRIIVNQFVRCRIINAGDEPRFDHIIASAMRLRESTIVNIVLIVLVYTLGCWVSRNYLPLVDSSWFSVVKGGETQFTPAGYWYVYISLPIFQFIFLRWYYHIIVWYRFLWQISRLPLRLNSLHPDRAGGLGFLENSIYALEPFLLAHTVLLSGMIFNRIWNAGAVIPDFKIQIVSIMIFVLIIPLVPLFFFTLQMVKEKRLGTLNYDVVASHYVSDFRQKWISSSEKDSSSLLGNPDIQSLADLANSYEVTNTMRITPFARSSIIVLVVFTALPLLPLLLTIIPLEKMISQMVGLIF